MQIMGGVFMKKNKRYNVVLDSYVVEVDDGVWVFWEEYEDEINEWWYETNFDKKNEKFGKYRAHYADPNSQESLWNTKEDFMEDMEDEWPWKVVDTGLDTPKRYEINTTQIKRCPKTSQELKELYNHTCQVCRTKLSLGFGEYKTETHHIHPVSHNGPDRTDNMLVLCANCHELFDAHALYVDPSSRVITHIDPSDEKYTGIQMLVSHPISIKNIEYNNLLVENRIKKSA
jgi:hypothetical protein